MRRSMLIAAVGLTAVAGLAGCGSSKGSDGASATTTTAAASAAGSGDATVASFTEQANALCASFEKKVDDMIGQSVSQGAAAQTDAAQAEFLAQGNTLVGDLASQMKALPQPDALSSQLQAIYADIAQMQSVTEQGITALQQGDTAQFTALSDQATTLSDSMDQQFDAIGVTACGSGAGSGTTTTTTG